ncbi:MAG: hypothetical protein ABSD03_11050 [Vulcanimicrobiaceae bacterium]|jgi:hypothetical protein
MDVDEAKNLIRAAAIERAAEGQQVTVTLGPSQDYPAYRCQIVFEPSGPFLGFGGARDLAAMVSMMKLLLSQLPLRT